MYVGKAIPSGARNGKRTAAEGTALYTRLVQHANSLESAENLRLCDFACRYLVVQPVWISLAERFLIAHYQPLWNVVVDGFGNHDPGRGRRAGMRPRWDILHPGRPWAVELSADRTSDKILASIEAHLRGTQERT